MLLVHIKPIVKAVAIATMDKVAAMGIMVKAAAMGIMVKVAEEVIMDKDVRAVIMVKDAIVAKILIAVLKEITAKLAVILPLLILLVIKLPKVIHKEDL